jgi:hypothetical protein
VIACPADAWFVQRRQRPARTGIFDRSGIGRVGVATGCRPGATAVRGTATATTGARTVTNIESRSAVGRAGIAVAVAGSYGISSHAGAKPRVLGSSVAA